MAGGLQDLFMEVAKLEDLQYDHVPIRKRQLNMKQKFYIIFCAIGALAIPITIGLTFWILVPLCAAVLISVSPNMVSLPVSEIITKHLTPEQRKDLVSEICYKLNTVSIPSASDFVITVARNPDRVEIVTKTVLSFVKSRPQIEFIFPKKNRSNSTLPV